MTTPVYVKMDARDPLLLSEGVCRQLEMIRYHPEVKPGGNCKEAIPVEDQCRVPVVRVHLVQSVKLVPNGSTLVEVQLIDASRVPTALVMLQGAVTPTLDPGEALHDVDPEDRQVMSSDQLGCEKQYLREVLDTEFNLMGTPLAGAEESLWSLMEEYHKVSSVEAEGEQGETDLTELQIDTGDAPPKRQLVRQVPFAARQPPLPPGNGPVKQIAMYLPSRWTHICEIRPPGSPRVKLGTTFFKGRSDVTK
jgi:hypothetical protein